MNFHIWKWICKCFFTKRFWKNRWQKFFIVKCDIDPIHNLFVEWYKKIDLNKKIIQCLWWKLTHKTQTTYSKFKKNFVLHCCLQNIFSFLVKSKILILWIIELNDFLTFVTIKAYLLNVWSAQIDLEFRNLKVFHHSWLKRIITGIKRQKKMKKRRKQRSITRNVLLKLFDHFNQNI